MIGSIAQIVASSNEKFQSIRKSIFNFMKAKNLEPSIQRHVRDYLDFICDRELRFDSIALLKSLPFTLAYDVETFLKLRCIRRVSYFSGCHTTVIAALASALEHSGKSDEALILNLFCRNIYVLVAFEGDFIMKSGLEGTDMYFIQEGRCEVLTSQKIRVATLVRF